MSFSPYLLKGQKALVTGGSSGIGESVVRYLAASGASVVVNYHSEAEEAHKIVDDIKSAGGEAIGQSAAPKAIAIQADVSKEDDVKAMFSQMFKEFGTIDILVNNAGLQKDSAFVDMTLDHWNIVIGVNLTGQFLCAREAAKEFLRRGVQPHISSAAGKIICMSSVHQVIPWAGHVNYAASKGGIDMMMRSLAQELAPHKIRVNFASIKGKRKGKKVNPPRFKKRTNQQSARLRKGGFSSKGDKVFLAKIGCIKTKWSRPLPSEPTSVTVIKDTAGRYFLSFVVEIHPEIKPAVNPAVAIDLGIKVFAACSDGGRFSSPDYKKLDHSTTG